MNIVICNERFLFRFGADRVLMLLAKDLHAAGHRITLLANRFEEAVVSPFVDRIITVPEPYGQYLNLNETAAEWLEANWSTLFPPGDTPELAIIGGWPFFQCIPLLKRLCGRAIYVDFGAVPLDGYSGGMLITQQKLRAMRAANIPHASEVVAISEFIRTTQSVPDSGGIIPTQTILLGADHLDSPLWTTATSKESESGAAMATANRLLAEGKELLFNLGRWEPGCYKNSPAAFDVLRGVRAQLPEAVLLVLGEPALEIPADLQGAVFPIGFPDDGELTRLMKVVHAGISVSLWEGFNLPIAEMQWLGGVALAFHLGAHPEVIAAPEYLCSDVNDMARKAVQVLSGTLAGKARQERNIQRFRRYFTWARHFQEYVELINAEKPPRERILIDVTSATIDPANTGVIRVTRRLCRELQRSAEPLFVVWDSSVQQYMFPTPQEYAQLAQFNGPIPPPPNLHSPDGAHRISIDQRLTHAQMKGAWLIYSELAPANRLTESSRYAQSFGIRCAAVFYDSIPLLRPDFCNEETRVNHAGYMTKLAGLEFAMPISEFSAQCLRDFWAEKGIAGCKVFANLLPGEVGGTLRVRSPIDEDGTIRILCVSTLEPRKNHRRLIAACQQLGDRRPDLKWSLTLIGNKYAGAFDLADWVQEVCNRDPRIQYLGIVSDDTLREHYQRASFTIYPSVIEGFGMPVLESVWNGKPCICSNGGVMAELADGGGCLKVNVEDVNSISHGIELLASDAERRAELTEQAMARKLKTWRDYVSDLYKIFKQFPPLAADLKPIAPAVEVPAPMQTAVSAPPAQTYKSWQEAMYGNCLFNNWQMNESERLALLALLLRHKPACSIEIGTYYGGSLSLIAQHSASVISIDIDPEVLTRIGEISNVHFLTGYSDQLLPSLFSELTRTGVGVDFILVDGDHSTEGIKRDVGLILDYVPVKPMYVLMHDSFNPACRQGMLDAGWERSPYCQTVELDFVPGRMIEDSGPADGELWGGLGMAYFLPTPRIHPLVIGRSADRMFRELSSIRKNRGA